MKKPEGADVVNIDDLNQNFDILDVEVVKVASPTQNGRMSAADKAKLDGIETGAQRNTIVSVNGKTGTVVLNASDVGASPAGHTHAFSEITSKPTTLGGYGITDAISISQKGSANGVASLDGSAKVPTTQLPSATTTQAGIVQLNDTLTSTSATQAATANAVKRVNDAVVAHSADTTKHVTQAEKDAWNSAEANAKAYTDTAPEAMQRNLGIFNVYKSGKDANGIFTTVEYKRTNGTLYARSVLSGGTSPQYTTRTITYYAPDGTTVLRTDAFTLTYDANGDLISEVKS
ncbi:phage tail protein [Anoxybacillus kestanbolensis]|uniref:phage tail protein n=1 Tax=Anoxybacillus kestanbolensis TaxID=227476 RepID=UPI00208DC06F|nr:tail fiber protein [Anoxybacillus kestanbolensis]MCL9971093.1 phage tail protein [Anoxybacillus kestanbolensis]